MGLPDSADRAAAIITAMEGIEADYESLRGVLPKAEYQKIGNDELGELLSKRLGDGENWYEPGLNVREAIA